MIRKMAVAAEKPIETVGPIFVPSGIEIIVLAIQLHDIPCMITGRRHARNDAGVHAQL